jgi:hypothetical protein
LDGLCRMVPAGCPSHSCMVRAWLAWLVAALQSEMERLELKAKQQREKRKWQLQLMVCVHLQPAVWHTRNLAGPTHCWR